MGVAEQRRAVRYDVAVSAEVYTAEVVLPASTRNLSGTGVCFDLNQELPEDTTVGVSLFLIADGIEDPDAEPLNIKASVIWCTERDDGGFSAGMRFEGLTSVGDETLGQFLSQLGE
ncbi:MAG: PilZ domain-containing protein [Deltaproteobacteria bacterium]|nr:PilZ domain-containing protein [Deltaproteobacteria bacterium]